LAVRREAVLLELEDHFTRETLAAAAAARTLEGALDDLDGSTVASTRSTKDNTKATDGSTKARQRSTKSTKALTLEQAVATERTNRLNKAMREQARVMLDAEGNTTSLTRDTDNLVVATDRAESSIDRFSGRMGILLKVVATLGPALIPLGAVGIAGVAGLASQLGFAAIAAGTAVAAFQGIGTALTAVHKASLEPTIENLKAARDALESLSPAGRGLVQQLEEMRPLLEGLRNTAARGLFPGLIDGFEQLEQLAPEVQQILRVVSNTLGDLFAEGAEALASDEWADFFHMIAAEARPALTDMGHALGSVVHGMSELWEAFMPLNRDFGSWLADGARGFDRWATGLSQTEGFQEFVTYLRENGPKLAEATTSVANALLQIVEAAAPLGGPVLDAIANIADAIALIADSPLGTPIMAAVTALSAMSLAANVATAATLRLNTAMATLGVTSKATAASTTAATGSAAAAGKAGPIGVGAFLGLSQLPGMVENLQMVLEGDRNPFEALARNVASMSGAGQALELFGVDVDGLGDELDDLTGASARFEGATLKLLDPLGHFQRQAEVLADPLRKFGRETEAILPATRRAIRAQREQQQAMRAQERQAERSRAAQERYNAAVRANAEAAQQAAAGFFDLGRKVKASEFTLDGWLDRLEDSTDAMRRFRENAEKAFGKGLDPELIQALRERGREGAVQLRELANANQETIDRANADWRAYQREIKLAGDEINTIQRLLNGFGKTDARADIGQDGAEEVAAAAARARAAVLDIPEKSDTSIQENGAAELAAAAARARAAVTSIPTSWTSTITVRKLGDLFDSGGWTGPGRKHDIAGIVHADEVVLPKEIVRRDRAMLQSRYGHLPGMNRMPGYAHGGWTGSERSMSSSRSSGNSTVVVRDRISDRLTLRIGDREFTAYIEGIGERKAQDVYENNREFERIQGG
jgi:hypothetical protein